MDDLIKETEQLALGDNQIAKQSDESVRFFSIISFSF